MGHKNIKQGIKSICLSSIVIITFMLSLAVCATADAETITYNYYSTGELKKAVYSTGKTVEYTYDASGNRTSLAITSVSPLISASPASLDFGPTIIGATSAPQTAMVTNTGSGPLEIEAVSISGMHAAEFAIQTDTCSNHSISQKGDNDSIYWLK